MKLSTINVKTTKIINAMKKIVALFITTVLSCVLYSQTFDYDYEWVNVTPLYSIMNVQQSAYTKGGKIIVATKEGYLAETSDTCKTWNITYDVLRDGINYGDKIYDKYGSAILSMSKDSLQGIFYAVGTNDTESSNVLLYTKDGGQSWNCSLSTLERENKILSIAWKNENTLFATVYNSTFNKMYLYSSIDAGCRWDKISTEDELFSTANSASTVYMAFVNDQLGYVFTADGYCVTTNGGDTWQRVELEMKPVYMFQFNNGDIILTVRSHISKTLTGCRIMNMFDKKDGWIEYYYVPEQVIDLGDGKVWAKVHGGTADFILSTDSLKTWSITTTNYSPENNNVLSKGMSQNIYYGNVETSGLYVKSEKECFVLGRQKGRLFHTKDGGRSWTYKDFNTKLYSMQFFQNDVIYMSSADSLFISRDGGDSWIGKYQYWSGAIGNKRMQFFTEKFGYIYDDYRLFQTQDGGDSWKEIYIDGDDFWDFGGTLNGCFANEHIGLFRSDNSKVIFAAELNQEKYTLNYSIVYEEILGNGHPQIYIDYINDKWILWDWWEGYIYTCDTDIHFTVVSTPQNTPQNYKEGNSFSSRILNYGNGKLLLPLLSENTVYPVETAMYSEDGGLSWNNIPFTMQNHLYINKSDNPNVVYTCKYDYYLSIYKGIHKVRTIDSSFEKQENGTIQCTINNADNQNYTAKVVLEQVNGTSIVVQDNVEIKSGEAFSITLPKSIEANYVIKVVPEDDEVFETVQSQEFIVNGSAIDAVSSDEIQIRVVNGKIECSCEEYAIYNVAGQKVQNNASLPSGTYFVHYGTQVKKVVVQ